MGRTVLVVGAGPVARRRAKVLAGAGAEVRLVAPELSAGEGRECGPFHPDHLDGVMLAFACGPPEVNAAVALEARARGILVSVADDRGAGDFHLPAVARRGSVVVSVGTGGVSPGHAGRLCRQIEAMLDAQG